MPTSKSIKFTGKNIVLADDILNYTTHNVESVLSNKLNYWKNWYCAIGINSIYIDYDGNIYNAVCRQGGKIGNLHILDSDITDTKDWVVCEKTVCTCGADMEIPKVKNKENIDKLFTNGNIKDILMGDKTDLSDVEIVFSTNSNSYKTITWAVGRRCNFDCWYCPDTDHNNFEDHKNFDQLTDNLDRLEKFWIKGFKVKFSLLGGELTVYKDYLKFVEHLYGLGHRSITTTNGSRDIEYYKKLAEVSDICFSIHLNYVKKIGLDKFIESVKGAIEGKNWITVRIMVDPGNLELAQFVYSRFKEEFQNSIPINVKPVHPAPNSPIFSYQPKEIFWIRNPH